MVTSFLAGAKICQDLVDMGFYDRVILQYAVEILPFIQQIAQSEVIVEFTDNTVAPLVRNLQFIRQIPAPN